MSKVFGMAPHPIAKFFVSAPEALAKVSGNSNEWSGKPTRFLSEIFRAREDLAESARKIKESAAVTVVYTDKFENRALSIIERQLDGTGYTEDKVLCKTDKKSDLKLAFADLMKVDVQWKQKGLAAKIGRNKAFTLEEHFTVASDKKTVKIITKNKDIVVMSMAYAATPATVLSDPRKMLEALEKVDRSFSGVTIPNTKLTYDIDLTNATGNLSIDDGKIDLLKQTSDLSMDSVGVKVVVKTVGRITKGIKREPVYLVFDKPFTMAIFRPEIEHPIFVAYCDKTTWGN